MIGQAVSGKAGRRARIAALLCGAAVLAMAAPRAGRAQDVAAPAVAPKKTKVAGRTEEVTVTGSRIRGVAPTGSTLISVTPKDLTDTGATTVEGALQDIPQITNLGVTEDSRISSGGAGNITYSSGIDIRGIGPYATLTLLDGQRMVAAGASGGLPDPSDVPMLMLSRVEVVPDGSSAIYGSDAIAGVANLILKRNVDDVEVLSRYGFAGNYDEHQVDILGGHTWNTGQVTFAVEDTQHSALNGQNRSFYGANLTPYGGTNYSSPNCTPANILLGSTSYAVPGLAPNTQNLCDNGKTQDLIPEQQRDSAAMTFNQKITDWMDVFASGLVSQRFFNFATGIPNGIVTVPSSNAFYIAPPGTHPASEQVETNFKGLAPAQGSSGSERMDQFTVGTHIRLPAGFRLTVDYTYGEDDAKSVTTTGLNNGALAAALASSNPKTAFNPYGVGPANNPALGTALFDQYFLAPGDNKMQEAEAKIDGPLFTLPAGDVRMAVGTEYDYFSLRTGFSSGVLPDVFNSRVFDSQQVHAAYGELYIPVFGSANALPLLQSLDFDIAGRYENYNGLGSTANPKLGLNWSPAPGLVLHGSYGTSFHAPPLSAIHGALNGLFVQPYATPNGVVQGVALSGLQGGNPLQPETARTFSAGADYRPPFFPDLHLSVNYFNIDYEKQITGYLSNLTILSSPQTQAEYASIIRTGPQAQQLVNQYLAEGYPLFGVLPSNVNYFIYGQNFNLGKTVTDGLDFSASLHLPVPERFGDITLGVNGTYFMDYQVQVTPTAMLLNQANNIFNPLRFRMRDSVNWKYDAVNTILFINYDNGYYNNTVTPFQPVSAYTTLDLHASYDFDEHFSNTWLKHTVFSIDVQNLLDANPPFVNIAESGNGGGGYDPTVANPIGRLISFSIDKKF